MILFCWSDFARNIIINIIWNILPALIPIPVYTLLEIVKNNSGSSNIGVVIMHLISMKQIRFGICYQYKCYENSAETNWKDEYRFFEEYVDFL